MSFGDVQERPAKKRRFFVDDSPIVDRTLTAEASLPDDISALPEIGSATTTIPQESSEANGISEEFDADLLSSFVGEHLPATTVQKLRELSGNNIERGACI
jgi:DNA repair protein RAD5